MLSRSNRYQGYRFFVENPEFDADLTDGRSSYPWLKFCIDIQCLGFLARNLYIDSSSDMLQTRFDLIMEVDLAFVTILPCDFLKYLGLQTSDPKFGALRSTRGKKSVLHFVAHDLFTEFPRRKDTEEAWFRLGVEALKNGADPHSPSISRPEFGRRRPAVNTQFWTTLLCEQANNPDHRDHNGSLDLKGLRSMLRSIRLWADMLRQSGIDLCQYGAREVEMWNSSREAMPNYITTKLVYGPTPADWSLEFDEPEGGVPIFQLRDPPGSFPRNERVPDIICWQPSNKEKNEGPWANVGFLKTSRSIKLEDMILSIEEAQMGLEKEPYTQLVDKPQDDTGALTLMQDRALRSRSSTLRSHSQPCYMFRRERAHQGFGRDIEGRRLWWYPEYHLCRSDARWNFVDNLYQENSSGPVCPRSRCPGNVGMARRPKSVQESISWSWMSFLSLIISCQEGYSSFMPRHTGRADCPEKCGTVDLNRLHVPAELKPYHPQKWRRLVSFNIDEVLQS